MEHFKIINHVTEAVICEGKAKSLKHLIAERVRRGVDLSHAYLSYANLRDVILEGANLRDVILEGANLEGANLLLADLSYTNLRGVDFRHANLRDANLRGASLIHANLYDADLRGANLYGAILDNADLSCANLKVANLQECSLQPVSVYDWVQKNSNAQRIINYRVMCVGRRDRLGMHIGYKYERETLYKSPIFSRSPITECHPGLYIGAQSWDFSSSTIYVAYWMDELVITSTDADKGRVPRFYTLTEDERESVSMFWKLDASIFDGEPVIVESKKTDNT